MRQNAAQLNRMQIREQEALNRERRLQDDTATRRQEQSIRRTQAQYDYVASHGYGRSGGSIGAAGVGAASSSSSSAFVTPAGGVSSGGWRSSANANVAHGDDVHIKVYVRECDEDAGQTFTYKEGGSAGGGGPARRVDGAPSVPSSSYTASAGGVSRRQPGAGRITTAAKTATGSTNLKVSDFVAPNRARVPRYLQQRKAEMAAEKEAVAAEAERQRQLSQIPPGHRRVSEDEKADTLRRIDERQQELEMQLAKIPIRFDTQSIQQRRRAIEDELRELEMKRNKYSTKNPLYVPLSQ